MLDQSENNKVRRYGASLPGAPSAMRPSQPLWKIVPTKDHEGKALVDFMIWVPNLRDKPQAYIETALHHIEAVLQRYQEVVFADFNVPINILWVSHKFRPGMALEIAAAIRVHVPEALLVAHKPHY